MKRILVVEDDRQIARMLRAALQASGYEVLHAPDGLLGLAQFESARPDLVITDLAMPEMNGVELTQAIRKQSDTPIIVLSVRDSEAMKVRALDQGANDYVTKPFNMPELLARARVQLRSEAPLEARDVRLSVGDLTLDGVTRRVTVAGNEVHLTPKEFDLLLTLASHPDRVLTHKQLLRAVWGPSGEDQPEYLRVLIAQLRKKIDTAPGPRHIESEPWVGYRLRSEPMTS
ncbi:MAG: response regulator transcription factor [Acidobacteriota bacterium]|nr:response regulator transcription factor [Acidobacteriota bacterium]